MNRILERLQQKPQATRLSNVEQGIRVKIAKKMAPVQIKEVKVVDKRGEFDRAAIMAKLQEKPPKEKVAVEEKVEVEEQPKIIIKPKKRKTKKLIVGAET